MKNIRIKLDELNTELTIEELKSITYNAFAVCIMLLPVVPEIMNFGFYSMKWTLFVSITLAASIALLVISIKEKSFQLTFLDVILGIYILFVGISTLLTKYGIWNAILGKNGRGEGLLLILCYSLTFMIFSKGYRYTKWTLKVGIIASAVVSIYSILQGILPIDVVLPFELKRIENVATGTMRNQNFLSSYICLFLPMMVYNYINTGKKTNIVLILMLFTAQIFSKTLGGYITFAAMYILIMLYSLMFGDNKSKVILRTILLTILLILNFVILNGINNNQYMEEVSDVKEETVNLVNKSDNFGTARLGIWRKSLMAINNNKWFGVGPDSLWNEISKKEYLLDKESDKYYRNIIDKAHSEPLQIAATTGIPSALTYLVLVSSICIILIKKCICSIKKDRLKNTNTIYTHMIFISIVSYLMQSMINISVVQVAPIFWAILGLGAGIIYDKNK